MHTYMHTHTFRMRIYTYTHKYMHAHIFRVWAYLILQVSPIVERYQVLRDIRYQISQVHTMILQRTSTCVHSHYNISIMLHIRALVERYQVHTLILQRTSTCMHSYHNISIMLHTRALVARYQVHTLILQRTNTLSTSTSHTNTHHCDA